MATITDPSQGNVFRLTPQAFVKSAAETALLLDPNLSASQVSSLKYILKTISDPNFDDKLCRQAGKVVHIAVKFLQQLEQVGIRGSAPLNWQSDQAEDSSQATPNSLERTFTFHVPPQQMNNTIEFKFCIPAHVREKVIWSSGGNYLIDLRQYGHIAIINIEDVSFSEK